MEELYKFIQPFEQCLCDKAVLSAVANSDSAYRKCKINLIKLKGENMYQVEQYTKTQVFHENIPPADIIAFIQTQLTDNYRQMEWIDEKYRHSVRVTKKGKVLHSRKATETSTISAREHNRKKEYLLPQDEAIPPLIDLGVITAEGKIVSSMYDKYKQINRFLEMIEDVVKQTKPTELNIIDFGCGKSYLTFIVYHYLNFVRKIPTSIVGMDLKEQVIDDCNAIARKYGYEKLTFIKGDIADYKPTTTIDMVITLHACDIATDLALYHAVNLNSRAILSVPCCQHEVNAQIQKSDTSTLFTRYGLVKERFSALATDAIRGNILEAMGYNTQLLEFVDLAHSPKNILIRAIKAGKPTADKKILLEEIEDFTKAYGVSPTLANLLKDKLY